MMVRCLVGYKLVMYVVVVGFIIFCLKRILGRGVGDCGDDIEWIEMGCILDMIVIFCNVIFIFFDLKCNWK